MKIFKKLFCKHDYKIPYASFLEPVDENKIRRRYLWKCSKCGRIKCGK